MENDTLKKFFARNHFNFLKINHERLLEYLSLLFEKNKVMNLVGKGDWEDLIEIHTRESLELFPSLPQEISTKQRMKVLDIGSGGGFPGIIIGIAKPNWTIHLVESISKKALFLSDVITELKLTNVFVHHARAEELVKDKRYINDFSLVMARGVGKYCYLYPLFIQFLHKDGLMVFWKKYDEIFPSLKEYPAKITNQYFYPVSSGEKSILVLSL